jgi:hypothetical protein
VQEQDEDNELQRGDENLSAEDSCLVLSITPAIDLWVIPNVAVCSLCV